MPNKASANFIVTEPIQPTGHIMKIIHKLGLFIGLWITTSYALAIEIDCTKAADHIDIMTCHSKQLTTLHNELDTVSKPYQQSIVFQLGYKKWLKNREECYDSVCLSKLYDELIESRHTNLKQTDPIVNKQSGKLYQLVTDKPWYRTPLTRVNFAGDVLIVSATIIDNVLYAILYQDTNSPNRAVFYEYASNRTQLYPIAYAKDARHDELFSAIVYGNAPQYAAIKDNVFYYQKQIGSNNKQPTYQAMAYTLGSRQQASTTTETFPTTPRIKNHAQGEFLTDQQSAQGHDQLVMQYTEANKTHRDIIAQGETVDLIGLWMIGGTIWSTNQPLMYFDNSSDYACIWRVDMVNKQLSKIVPEHDTKAPYPLNTQIDGLEAILYTEYHKGYANLMLSFSFALQE